MTVVLAAAIVAGLAWVACETVHHYRQQAKYRRQSERAVERLLEELRRQPKDGWQ